MNIKCSTGGYKRLIKVSKSHFRGCTTRQLIRGHEARPVIFPGDLRRQALAVKAGMTRVPGGGGRLVVRVGGAVTPVKGAVVDAGRGKDFVHGVGRHLGAGPVLVFVVVDGVGGA